MEEWQDQGILSAQRKLFLPGRCCGRTECFRWSYRSAMRDETGSILSLSIPDHVTRIVSLTFLGVSNQATSWASTSLLVITSSRALNRLAKVDQ
ncbi:hypothetical protein EB234_29435 [Mesorhizobium japonicum R7A]|nr:hypothetical protein EB234_29435 [Mesorhizobium japonicum R7A]